jgi:exopolysaccharide biosynthesis WecB/TagA/CpsF family protein
MALTDATLGVFTAPPAPRLALRTAPRRQTRNAASIASDLLPLCDVVCLFFAASIGSLLFNHWLAPVGLLHGFGNDSAQAALIAAIPAPFILYDKRFGSIASRGHASALVRSHGLRFALFAGMVLALGILTQVLDEFPHAWLAIWLTIALLSTSLTRVLVAKYVQRLQRQGVLTEVIAVVGAGPVADRLVHVLRQTRPETIELLGVFDDEPAVEPATIKPAGTLAQLIELGKTRKIDWILLTLPPTAEHRLLALVQRLKALAVPIGLCSQHVGLALPLHNIDYVGDNVPVSLLADRPVKRWDAVIKAGEDSLPRWLITSTVLPLVALKELGTRLVEFISIGTPRRGAKLALSFDDHDVTSFADVAARFGLDRYGYAVTPNADHMIRLHEDAAFRASYAAADHILLDSRFLSHLLRVTRRIRLPVCPGSDLTARLFAQVISPADPLVLIGGTDEQARQLAARYDLQHLAHFNPPMGFIRDPEAVEVCLRFIEAHSPFRFCLLAVGAPQQEALAQQLKLRGSALGLALCIGASISFLIGSERRAPRWLQLLGMEWSFRLMQEPGRLTRRYLVRGPRVFRLLNRTEIVLRAAPAPEREFGPANDSTQAFT